MFRTLQWLFYWVFLCAGAAYGQSQTIGQIAPDTVPAARQPFGNRYYGWMNGQNRQEDFPISGKWGTAMVYIDTYYNYNFSRPIDNTQTISYVTGRHNEFQVNLASIGYEGSYKNAYGRLTLQVGNLLEIVQDRDQSVRRGQNLASSNLRHIREATAGYHFDVRNGLNVEMGIFLSYVGLESYMTQENWLYQRSFVCEFTPFYFSGARASYYPNDKLKIEPWVMNGFQSYGKYNKAPSTGLSIYYRPTAWLGFIANFYDGFDTPGKAGRVRVHHDHSMLLRYHDAPEARGLSKAAFTINNHIGFESGGGGPGPDSAYMLGTSVMNRLWFAKNKLAITVRGEYVTNPTRYMAIAPLPAGFDPANPDQYRLAVWGFGTGIDIMPSDHYTLRLEFVGRWANIPYYIGQTGVTSPDGYQGTPLGDWHPVLRKNEQRIILAANFRI